MSRKKKQKQKGFTAHWHVIPHSCLVLVTSAIAAMDGSRDLVTQTWRCLARLQETSERVNCSRNIIPQVQAMFEDVGVHWYMYIMSIYTVSRCFKIVQVESPCPEKNWDFFRRNDLAKGRLPSAPGELHTRPLLPSMGVVAE